MSIAKATDPTANLLLEREVHALKTATLVRFIIIGILAPTAWVLGSTLFDRLATTGLVTAYGVVLAWSLYFVNRHRNIKIVGLVGVALDVIVIGALPMIWYTALGGGTLPLGVTLKTSVTLIAVLFISLNTLAIRPLYPLLVTIGALIVHFLLLVGAVIDPDSVFTGSYLVAYTTEQISTGRVATRILIVILVGIILTLLTMRARQMIIESAELQKTNIQLGRYFSPNLVAQLKGANQLFRVGGERKDLSFVFTDLEGFTTLVETNDPALVVPALNGYLDQIIQVAFRHDGTVEKIVGDAIHIIFGAPMEQLDHAERAIACALEIDVVAQRYQQRSGAQLELGKTRIGVNSGPAVVGNFGGDGFFDYTAHGDAINTAARLEGANKYLGTSICVGEETVSRVKKFIGRPIGILWLKGKRQGIKVYEPLGNLKPAILASYMEIYTLMESEDPHAILVSQKHCQLYPEDALAQFHLNRLRTGSSGVRITLEQK